MTLSRRHWILRSKLILLNSLKRGLNKTIGFSLALFAIIPEDYFNGNGLIGFSFNCLPEVYNTFINRLIVILCIYIFCSVALFVIEWRRSKVIIEHKDYTIEVENGDLLTQNDGKIIIPFDECFNVKVSDKPEGINKRSICGQFLEKHPLSEEQMTHLISEYNLKPNVYPSQFQNKDCYPSGILLPYDKSYLLLSFTKLNKDGLGVMSRKEIWDCLWLLWEQIDKYYNQNDIYMPILGSGVTRIRGETLTQQELLDMIIYSYKLSEHKIKKPNALHIIYKIPKDMKQDKNQGGFILDNIGKTYI